MNRPTWPWKNPVVVKEVRTRMRGNRAFLALTLHLVIVASITTLVYLFFSASMSSAFSSTTLEERRSLGKVLFGLVILLELVMVSFIAPALTAGAISMERERQTYDLLRVTLLPARALVLGKYFSGMTFILLMLFTAIPLHSPAFLMGGVLPQEILIGTLILLVTAATFCAAGAFFSSLFSRTLVSTVLSYAFAIFLMFGIPLLILIFLIMMSITSGQSFDRINITVLAILMVAAWLTISISPLSTIAATETFFLSDDSIWLAEFPLRDGQSLHLLSPWIPYVITGLVLTFVLLLLSVEIVRRVEK